MQAFGRPITTLATTTTTHLRKQALLSVPSDIALSCRNPQSHYPHQVRHATTKAKKEKKTTRALVRARREQQQAMAAIVTPGDWPEIDKNALKQGLKELEGSENSSRRGSYAAKPLLSNSKREDMKKDSKEGERERYMTPQETWARDALRVWNEILGKDAESPAPRISIPGFPIEVIEVIAARDCGHMKVYWKISDFCNPSPELSAQLDEAVEQGHDPELVVGKTITQLLERRQGFLRTRLAEQFPMRRVPDVSWRHASNLAKDSIRKW